MSGEKLKQGYIQKFAKGVVSDSWQKVYVELYKDSLFVWYKKKNDKSNKGNVTLKSICEYLTVGSYCRAIPYSPEVPSGCSLEHMIAFPQEPNRKSKIHFFLCSNQQEFNEWMNAIGSTLPPKPQPPPPAGEAPIVPTAAYNAYAPAPPTGPSAPIAAIGFENLSISGQPPPYSSQPPYPPSPQPQAGYAPYPPPQPYPPQPYPPQSYAQQPYRQQSYPPQPYSQQTYPQQPYPQQPYPQQPYPQQPYPQQPHHQGYPPQQPYPQQPYPQQPQMYGQRPPGQYYGGPSSTTTVIYQNPQPQQTVIVNDHRSHGMGVLGGAVAGYAMGRMFGGYGYGYGWGHGSWGSCSWGSRSWGSFSGGSWGSFGGFD